MSNSNGLKNKVLSGLAWKFSERISAQLVTFVVSIVLARLLEPSHYGAIAIVNIFIALANVFVSSGFGNSLIQKKGADNLDYSSVFYFNIVMTVSIYAILFLLAPVIANFYNMPILCPTLRVLGIRLIIGGVNSVQHAYVSKNMMFKRFFWSTLFGTLLSGVVGIVFAYKGFGIWALVAQYMTNTTVDTIVLWFTVRWRPDFAFSFKRLKSLFSYGWKLLVSSLLNTAYLKFRGLVIGKMFSPDSFAFYNKGEHFPALVVTNVNDSIQSVLFPAMSSTQDRIADIKFMVRRSIKISSYIMFPLMMGMACTAEQIVILLLTEKWAPAIPYLQISCLVYCWMPIHTANLQAINAVGRSDIFLKLEIIKKVMGITLFLCVVRHGVWAVAVCGAISSTLNSLINAFPNRKLLKYNYLEQLSDLLPATLLSLVMGACVIAISFLPVNSILLLVIQVILGMLVYVLLSAIFKIDSYKYIKDTIKNLLCIKKGNNDG